jgi:hypothetical protein
MLGYGIPEDSLTTAIRQFDIDYIACDAGSIDQGPNYLGQGKFLADPRMVERDLRLLLNARDRLDVPLLVSSAGGSGSREHLEATLDIFRNVAAEEGLQFDLAAIRTDVDHALLKDRLDAVTQLDYQADVTPTDIANAEKIVGQIGPEPYIEALESGADVVVGGRSIDEAPFAAPPLIQGMGKGLTYHLAKILECGAMASEPRSGSDCLIGRITGSSFEVEPSNPNRRCTTQSVAAHTLYEKADPYTIHLPSGEVDVSNSTFEQVSDRRVRVSNSKYTPDDKYTILLEGVEKRGYRTITLAGMRGNESTSQINSIVSAVTETVREIVDVDKDRYELSIRRYGRDAVPLTDVPPIEMNGELGIVIDAVGDTQEIANTVCGITRTTMLHHSFDERLAVSGNLAIPYSPADIELGAVYEFSIYHLLEGAEPTEMYDLQTEVVT